MIRSVFRGRVNANRPTSVDDTKTLRFPFLEGHHLRGLSPTTLGELLRERFYCDVMGFTVTDRGQALLCSLAPLLLTTHAKACDLSLE